MKSELINVRPDARKQSNGCHGELEREEWRDVKGYEGYYQVSSFGRVRSVDRKVVRSDGLVLTLTGAIKKQTLNWKGYPFVNLPKDGRGKTIFVHRLVMEAFVPNPDNLPFVNHRNEVKTSNYPDNMEWCNNQYNCNYGTRNLRRSQMLKGVPRSEITKQRCRESNRYRMRQTVAYTKDGQFVKEFESVAQASREMGVQRRAIWSVANGKSKSAGGYIWKYKE